MNDGISLSQVGFHVSLFMFLLFFLAFQFSPPRVLLQTLPFMLSDFISSTHLSVPCAIPNAPLGSPEWMVLRMCMDSIFMLLIFQGMGSICCFLCWCCVLVSFMRYGTLGSRDAITFTVKRHTNRPSFVALPTRGTVERHIWWRQSGGGGFMRAH